jgi:hypothetical protein
VRIRSDLPCLFGNLKTEVKSVVMAAMVQQQSTSIETKLQSFDEEANIFVGFKHSNSPSTMPVGSLGSSGKPSQEPQHTEPQNTSIGGNLHNQMATAAGIDMSKNEKALSSSGHHHPKEPSGDPTLSTSAQSSPDVPILTESSTLSMEDLFDEDIDVPPPTTSHYADDSEERADPHAEDGWYYGDGVFLEDKAEEPTDWKNPPISMHSSTEKQFVRETVPKSIPGSNHGTNTDKGSNASSLESCRNTPTSISGSQIASSGPEVHTGGSVSSHNSSGARSGSSIPRPLLYSAIGSLESLNATSPGSLNKRLLATNTGKEFSRLGGGQSTLIPPANTHQAAPRTSWHHENKSTSESSNRTKTPRSSNAKDSQGNGNGRDRKGEEQRKKVNGSDSKRNSVRASRATDSSSSTKAKKPSNLRRPSGDSKESKAKRVLIRREALKKKKPVEMFRPSCDAYTPRIEKKSIKYRAAELRTPVQKMATPMGTLQRPNFRDALRRVAMIIHQHITKIETRFEHIDIEATGDQGLFKTSMRDVFSESNYCTPKYKCTMVRIPMARPGMVFGLRKIKTKPCIPSEGEIYEFAHQLFKSVQLSSECSIVCLIYVERLMEIAKVPLLACTWRPVFMCGLLLASKVWQDLSSWNIEFASVYPQYSLDAINRLELNFLRNVKWDLYISSRYVLYGTVVLPFDDCSF